MVYKLFDFSSFYIHIEISKKLLTFFSLNQLYIALMNCFITSTYINYRATAFMIPSIIAAIISGWMNVVVVLETKINNNNNNFTKRKQQKHNEITANHIKKRLYI